MFYKIDVDFSFFVSRAASEENKGLKDYKRKSNSTQNFIITAFEVIIWNPRSYLGWVLFEANLNSKCSNMTFIEFFSYIKPHDSIENQSDTILSFFKIRINIIRNFLLGSTFNIATKSISIGAYHQGQTYGNRCEWWLDISSGSHLRSGSWSLRHRAPDGWSPPACPWGRTPGRPRAPPTRRRTRGPGWRSSAWC